jgi:hypothetical protein
MVETLAIKIVGAIAALILSVLTLPKLFGRKARLRRKLRSAERRAIRDLADVGRGPHRIAGMVVADTPLIAPLSGRPCVFYETRVIRAVGLGLDPWDVTYQVAVEKRCVPFLVDDGTGSAVVDAGHAELLLGTDVDRWSHGRDADPPAESAFLARFGQRRRGLLFEKRLHFTESIIEVGERIAVMGSAVHDPARSPSDDSPYRQHHTAPRQCRVVRSSQSSLIITDDQNFAPPLDDE